MPPSSPEQTLAKKKTTPKPRPSSGKSEEGGIVPGDYPQLLSALRSRIQTARVQAHLAVNRERTLLYWDIGQMIEHRQQEEGWGSAVIPRLAVDLKTAFPEISGFSERNLKRMIAFHREYPAVVKFVPQPVAQLPDPQSDLARELIKDSFNLEFLDVREAIHERQLEESLIEIMAA